MKIASLFAAALASGAVLVGAAGASAAVSVQNPSFEILPSGGLPNGGCGVGCSYSDTSSSTGVPDWTQLGTGGQFRPGSSSGNTAYFNYVPNGLTVAWLDGSPTGDAHNLGGYLYQQVGTVTPGVTYTLNVDLGFRKDVADNGVAALQVGATTDDFYATGTADQLSGNWADYVAQYTGTAGDAGAPLYVVLFSGNSGQADFDNVSLSVPEPGTWALMLLGLGVLGATLRRSRKRAVALATA